VRASSYYGEVRRAAGLEWYIPGKGAGTATAPDSVELARLLASSRAMELAAVGTIGLLAIVWLMVMKPF
jgi:uncharacterized membrane protein